MGKKKDIPCAGCKLWNAKAKAFSCEPNRCGALSQWLLKKVPHLPQLNSGAEQKPEQTSETPIQYVI